MVITNTNVPVVGSQYAWVYNAGGTKSGAKSSPGGTFLSMGRSDGVGAYLNGVTNYFNGYIGAWKIYNRALTATEVS